MDNKPTILQIGDPILRQTARKLSCEEILSDEIQALIKTMQEVMYEAPGVGLAAPQIGKSLQLIVIEDKEELLKALTEQQIKERKRMPVPFHVIINPRIITDNPDQADFFEGCLSVAGFLSLVPRALNVTVECLNEHAKPITIKARGWYARILQHEIDHLNGTLCIDHMRSRSLITNENYRKYWKDKSVAEICAELKIF